MLTAFNRMLDKPDLGKLLLRFTFGAMMLFHGIHKLLFGIDGIIGMVQAHGMPAIVAYGVFLGEIIVPLMFIFGILVRPAALIFSFTMLFAWLITEPGIIFTLTNVGAWGLENIAVYLFAGLAIALLGCGRYSVMSTIPPGDNVLPAGIRGAEHGLLQRDEERDTLALKPMRGNRPR